MALENSGNLVPFGMAEWSGIFREIPPFHKEPKPSERRQTWAAYSQNRHPVSAGWSDENRTAMLTGMGIYTIGIPFRIPFKLEQLST
jgi:hypothetical protein